MIKERIYQLILAVILFLFILVSYLAYILFGEVFMYLLMITLFTGGILVVSELYLRIKWNIERKGRINSRQDVGVRTILENTFKENKKVDEEIVILFEQFLEYLEEVRRENKEEMNRLNGENKKLQEKMSVLNHKVIESQKDQMNILMNRMDKLEKFLKLGKNKK